MSALLTGKSQLEKRHYLSVRFNGHGDLWQNVARCSAKVWIPAHKSAVFLNTKYQVSFLRWRQQVNRRQGVCKLCSSAPATPLCQALLLFKARYKMQSTVHFAKYNHALKQTMWRHIGTNITSASSPRNSWERKWRVLDGRRSGRPCSNCGVKRRWRRFSNELSRREDEKSKMA